MQVLHLSWGRVTRVWTLEGTVVLAAALATVAAAGIDEATATPVVD